MDRSVTVYSAVFGGYDKVRPPKVPGRFVLLTDGPGVEGWEVWRADPLLGPQRTARSYKTNVSFPPAYVWLDGNIELLVPAAQLVDEWLGDTYDIALFQHPAHDCLYREAQTVMHKGKDEVKTVLAQMRRYQAVGFPQHYGLGETCILARSDNDAVREFNRLWWEEIKAYSARDQLSFDYVRWVMGDGIKVNRVYGGAGWRRRQHPWFACWRHGEG